MKKITTIIITLILLISTSLNIFAYSDVVEGVWYEHSADYLHEKGIMIGSDKNTFMPKRSVSRAAAITCLCKALNIEIDGKTETEFTDCDDTGSFLPYIIWGCENGIAVGYGNRYFPNSPLIREQLCVILKKVCEKYDIENKYKTNLTGNDFSDYDLTSTYAREAVDWCITEGYMTGTSNSTVAPWKYVSRAEFSLILYNLMYVRENGFLPKTECDESEYPIIETTKTRVICWGDSLTSGVGGNAYPSILRDLIKLGVTNYGVGGETAEHIAMRQGSIPCYVAPCVIPGDCSDVKIKFLNENGHKVDLAYFGVSGLSTIVIGGVEGHVFYSESEQSVIFQREEPGKEVVLNRITRVITKGMRNRGTNDICVFFVGCNNGFPLSSVDYFIGLIEDMISFSESDKYVVIGLTSKYASGDFIAINECLHKHFGEKFLDIRKYLTETGLSDAKINPTEQDLLDISTGEIPSSLRSDNVHGNTIYYTLLAKQLKAKFISLGYIE